MLKEKILFFFVFLLIPILLLAKPKFGEPAGFVNDYAGILSAEQKQSLETKLSNFEKQSTNEIAVVTIKSLEGDTIENVAVELFEQWGIGKKDKDNGVLILIALDEKKMRIEVGYGLEPVLTDAQSWWVIDKIMKPAFQQENYYQGVDGAVDKIIAATQGEAIPTSEKDFAWIDFLWIFMPFFIFLFIWLTSILGRSKSWWLGGVLGGIIGVILTIIKGFFFVGLIGLAILIPFGLLFDYLVSRAYKKGKETGHFPWWIGGRGFGSGSGSKGFGGFGGGSSGGGGASGSW